MPKYTYRVSPRTAEPGGGYQPSLLPGWRGDGPVDAWGAFPREQAHADALAEGWALHAGAAYERHREGRAQRAPPVGRGKGAVAPRPGGKPGPMHDRPGSRCAPVPAFVHGNYIWEPVTLTCSRWLTRCISAMRQRVPRQVASEKINPSAGFGLTSSTRNAAIFRAHRAQVTSMRLMRRRASGPGTLPLTHNRTACCKSSSAFNSSRRPVRALPGSVLSKASAIGSIPSRLSRLVTEAKGSGTGFRCGIAEVGNDSRVAGGAGGASP